MNLLKTIASIICFLFFCNALQAQDIQNVEMADVLRSNGKIGVVIAVIGVVLVSLVYWLVVTDRKISKLEKSKAADETH